MWEYVVEGETEAEVDFYHSSQKLAYGYEQNVYSSLFLFKLGYLPTYSFITNTLGIWVIPCFL